MKSLLAFLALIIFNALYCFAQLGHVAPCTGANDHSSGNCYGYATGRAGGKGAGDPYCNPTTLNLNGINTTNYFDWTPGASLVGLQHGDIVHFNDHVVYVVTVNSPTGTTVVDHYRTISGQEETGVTLDSVKKEGYGSWDGYYRPKTIEITVENNFYGGDVIVGSKTDAGSKTVEWVGTLTIGAVDFQQPASYVLSFVRWGTPGEVQYTGTMNLPVRMGTYRANFDSIYNVTFVNSLPGASGGQIKVGDTTGAAPYYAHTRTSVSPSITAQAITQTVSYIDYTFSHWQDQSSVNPRTFTPNGHTTYTASYYAKPQPPTNLDQVAPVGQYVHLTWSDNPNDSVGSYNIYRHPVGQTPTKVDSVNRGVQTWTDPDITVTDPKDGTEYIYTVRSVFQGVESNDATVSTFGEYKLVAPGELAFKLGDRPPSDFAISSYPNPFNPTTTIFCQLAADATVELAIYDIMGRRVRMLVAGIKSAGYHTVVWSGKDEGGRDVSSGVYLYRFEATPTSGEKPFRQSGKLVLTR